MIRLTDIVSSFPLPDDEKFNHKISSLKEFYNLKSSNEENKRDSDSSYFYTQILISRLLSSDSTIREMYVNHAIGSGKTGVAIAVAELYKNNVIGVGRKKALVVVVGDTVEQSFKSNLAKIKPEYAPSKKYNKDSSHKSALTKNIKEFYELKHYASLSNDIKKIFDKAKTGNPEKDISVQNEIKDLFNDRVIIFDEAHNFRKGYFKPDKKSSTSSNLLMEDKKSAEIYETIHKMLHMLDRRVIILLSATPIVDKPIEFGLQMNLLLPLEKQIPLDFDWDKVSVENLEPYIRGRFSYVRGSHNVPRAKNIGRPETVSINLNNKEEVVDLFRHYNNMSTRQYFHYLRTTGDNVAEDINTDEEEKQINELNSSSNNENTKSLNAFHRDDRYASLFVFPLLKEEEDELIEELDKRMELVANGELINYISDKINSSDNDLIQQYVDNNQEEIQNELEKINERSETIKEYFTLDLESEYKCIGIKGFNKWFNYKDKKLAVNDFQYSNSSNQDESKYDNSRGNKQLVNNEIIKNKKNRLDSLLKAFNDNGGVGPLKDYSATFYSIIKSCILDNNKATFVFTEFVKGPGCPLIGYILNANGYKEFSPQDKPVISKDDVKTNELINKMDKEIDDLINYQNKKVEEYRELKQKGLNYKSVIKEIKSINEKIDKLIPELESIKLNSFKNKVRRYAVITGDTDTAYRDAAFAAFNDPLNINGDYIQVLIGSNVTKEGISFIQSKAVHIVNPYWNSVPVTQAVGRVFRENSLSNLRLEDREIDVYMHTAIGPDDYKFYKNPESDEYFDLDYYKNNPELKTNTIDVILYGTSEIKKQKISKVLYIAKRCAVDGLINKDRNQSLDSRYDNTEECDYNPCKFNCVGSEVDAHERPLPPIKIDDSNYFINYSDEEIYIIKEYINDYFLMVKNNAYTLEISNYVNEKVFQDPSELSNIINEEGKIDIKYVIKALDEIIQNNEPLINTFGDTVYLKKKDDLYFIQELLNGIHPESNEYSNLLVATEGLKLSELIAPLKNYNNILLVKNIRKNVNINTIHQLFQEIVKYDRLLKSSLLEEAYLADEKDRTKVDNLMIELCSKRLFFMNGYVLHNLLTYTYSGSNKSYNANNLNLKNIDEVRILNKEKRKWEYINFTKKERDQLIELVKFQFDNSIEESHKESIYVYNSINDGMIRLYVNPQIKSEPLYLHINEYKKDIMTNKGKEDSRTKSRGISFTSVTKKGLIPYALMLGVKSEDISDEDPKIRDLEREVNKIFNIYVKIDNNYKVINNEKELSKYKPEQIIKASDIIPRHQYMAAIKLDYLNNVELTSVIEYKCMQLGRLYYI